MTGGEGTSVRDPGPGMKATDNNKTLGYFFLLLGQSVSMFSVGLGVVSPIVS